MTARPTEPRPFFAYLAWITAATLAGLLILDYFSRYVAERRAAALQTTICALGDLQYELTSYLIDHHRLPGPTLRDAIMALEKDGRRYNERHGVRSIEPGVDAWGQELIYELLGPGRAVIRSIGPNGIDEKGGGDDIQEEVSLERIRPPGEFRKSQSGDAIPVVLATSNVSLRYVELGKGG